MRKELTDFIRHLSVNDKKTLIGKALKTSEEMGELAKAVLPFENASGTLHRFTDKAKILDCVADVYLSAMSIAYALEFSDEEIEDMIKRKSRKWSGLQANEANVKFPLPYEIHITVERPTNLEFFKSTCQEIGVKPIIIDLEKNGELVMSDVMTSSVHFGNNTSALAEAERIVFDLNNTNPLLTYKVLRTKIETVPWHPAAPSIHNDLTSENDSNYFESHLRIITTKDRRNHLEEVAKKFGAHLSRNFFKKISESEYIIMMTLRDYRGRSESFQRRVEELKDVLVKLGYEVDKTEIEFAIYDTNVSHDKQWIQP